MLVPWLALPNARELLACWSDSAQLDLLTLGTTAGPDALTDTGVAQPLLTAVALLAASALPTPRLVTGHSVGEVAAMALAGVITPTEAIALAATRGRAMAAACALESGGMAAVLGGDIATVCESVADGGLEVAIVNGVGHHVVAGRSDRIAAFTETPPPATKVRRLTVAGAFHTRHMNPAVRQLADHAARLRPRDPVCALISNFDGRIVRTGSEALALLVAQLTRTVRWDLCQRTLHRGGATTIVELPPAGVLTGIARRALPGARIVCFRSPADDPASTSAV